MPDVAAVTPTTSTPPEPNGKAKADPVPPEKAAEAKAAERNAKADALIEQMLSKAEEPEADELDDGEAEGDEPKPDAKPTGKAKPKQRVEEPSEEDAEEATAEEAEPTADDEARAEKKGLGFRVEQARRYKKQGDTAFARADALMREAQGLKASVAREAQALAPAREIAQAIQQGDFSGAIDRLARSVGISSDEVLLAYAERRANGGKPGEHEALLEMRRLRAEIAQERKEALAERQRLERMGEMTQHQRLVQGSVQRIAAIRSNDELAVLWPHAASLPDDVFDAACTTLVDEALAQSGGRPVVLDDIAAKLDEYAGKLYQSFSRSNRLRSQVPGDTGASERENPSGKGTPAARAAKPAVRRTVTSQLSAEPSARRAMTDEERWAKADELAAKMARDYLAPESDDSD